MPATCAYMPKIPREEWRRRDCSMDIPPGGVISRFLSLCLSGEHMRPIVKTSQKKIEYCLVINGCGRIGNAIMELLGLSK